jgi:hypothetical protein
MADKVGLGPHPKRVAPNKWDKITVRAEFFNTDYTDP